MTVKDIVGTDPVRAAHSAAPPNSVTSSAACGADFTSFHSMAGRTTAPGVVQRDHAVLLRGHPDRVGPLEQVAPGRRERLPPAVRMALGPVRVGRGRLGDDSAVLGLDEEHLGGLSGGIDPCDQRHAGR